MPARRRLYLMLVGILVLLGCQRTPSPPSVEAPAATTAEPPLTFAVGDGPKDLPGVHNVVRVTKKLYSGGVPEGAEGFGTLRRLGIRTVITVDGAVPDVALARKFDLRYVHLPIGYDGVPREQGLRLARAVRDLPGPIFIHCHHGKHRSPAAAAAVHLCLDGTCNAETALALLKQAGTGVNYQGLYAVAKEFSAVTDADLDRVPAEFPETAPPGMFVQLMVSVDTHWDHLKLIRAAGWRTPTKHPDLDPAHEALLLREGYRETVRLPEGRDRSPEMYAWLVEAEKHAQQLEDALRASKTNPDHAAVEAAYKLAATDCSKCHAKYRDVRKN